MAKVYYELTDQLEQTIVAFVRAGGFLHVAAEAAGVPRRVFERWLRCGERSRGPERLQEFARAVRQAHAQARLGAEATALTEKPLDWLRNGPGRETPERAGWAGTVRIVPAGQNTDSVLLNPVGQKLMRRLLDALTPFSEARVAASSVLEELPRRG
jgi:hypothetical protein